MDFPSCGPRSPFVHFDVTPDLSDFLFRVMWLEVMYFPFTVETVSSSLAGEGDTGLTCEELITALHYSAAVCLSLLLPMAAAAAMSAPVLARCALAVTAATRSSLFPLRLLNLALPRGDIDVLGKPLLVKSLPQSLMTTRLILTATSPDRQVCSSHLRQRISVARRLQHCITDSPAWCSIHCATVLSSRREAIWLNRLTASIWTWLFCATCSETSCQNAFDS
nr:hypothetical protein CFP56_52852 [Quercus suber]